MSPSHTNTLGQRCEINALHIPDPDPGAYNIDWTVYDGQAGTMRNAIATCTAHTTMWEIGTIGGAYRIRRTERRPSGVRVHITPANATRGQVDKWWDDLRDGKAI